MKLYSLEEANDMLPTLRRLLGEIRHARKTLRRLEPEARRAAENAAENGGTTFGLEYAAAITRFLAGAQEILSLGIEIKDFDRGLCDFPHLRDGKVVYLCWQHGEESIEWWHDIEAGFAGRQPL